MKVIIATFLIIFVFGDDIHCLAAKKNSTSTLTSKSTTKTTSNATPITTPKTTSNATPITTSKTTSNTTNTSGSDLVAPGITVSKGFKKANCLASRFAVLCASGSIDGCVTQNSKTKCGKQCVCGPSDCACGRSGCYCQVNAACRCNQ